MSEKVRIGEMFIPILPKKYRHEENYINCDDILCSQYDIDCHICPVIFHKVKEKKLDIIECNQRLIEVNLWGELLGCIRITFKRNKETWNPMLGRSML